MIARGSPYVATWLAAAAGAVAVVTTIAYILLRTTGVLGFRAAGEFPPVMVVLVTLALFAPPTIGIVAGGLGPAGALAVGVLFGSSALFFGLAVLFALGFDVVATAGSELAAFLGTLAGLSKTIAAPRKLPALAGAAIGVALGALATTGLYFVNFWLR